MNSATQEDAGASAMSEKAKMAVVYAREPSFEDNRSDLFEDDEDSREFLRHNESDEGWSALFCLKPAIATEVLWLFHCLF